MEPIPLPPEDLGPPPDKLLNVRVCSICCCNSYYTESVNVFCFISLTLLQKYLLLSGTEVERNLNSRNIYYIVPVSLCLLAEF